jgi:hypothetical protein
MTWEGPSAVMREALAEVGADFVWTPNGGSTPRIGPDLPDEDDTALRDVATLPVVPFGKGQVIVADHAVYYVRGEPRELVPFLNEHAQAWVAVTTDARVTDPIDLVGVVRAEPRDLRCGQDWRCPVATELWVTIQARYEDAIDNIGNLPEEIRWGAHEVARERYYAHVEHCDKVGEE